MAELRQQDPFAAGSGTNFTSGDQNNYNMPNPISTPTPTQDTSGTTQGGSNNGGFNLGNVLNSQLGNFQGVLSNPMLIPAFAAAMQQFNQANQYTDYAEKYAGQLDPFGQQRGQYQQLLSDSYSDPSKVLADPAHQAELKANLDNVARTGASQGFLGSGNMEQALYDYSSKDNAAWLQNYRQGLITPSGANIGPEASAAMLMTGLNGRMGAQNNAVGNMMLPFLMQAAQNKQPGSTTNGTNGTKIPATAQGAQAAVQALTARGIPAATAAQMFQQLISNPGSIDASTLQIMQAAGIATPGMDGGMDSSTGTTYQPSFGDGIDPSYDLGPNQGSSAEQGIMNSDPNGGIFGGNPFGSYNGDPTFDNGASTYPYDNSGGFTYDDSGNYDNYFGGGSTNFDEITFP